jgi:uncharacterized phage protein gp47/JayE/DNA-binding protein Fis
MFEPKSFDQIFEAMRNRTPPRISDFEPGSVARTLYETFAFEMALLYEQMHQVYLSAFVDTATEANLDRVVAVLGLKRGEPDFAMGMVTFERDTGLNEAIDIPLGFLVTTSEDSETSPKKAYRTIEVLTLAPTDSQVEVRVQAVQRGETEATAAHTIQVMPQPLPGIKTITNAKEVRFTGKRRETDEELRSRAKTALLAASGANISAIETALLSLAGVKEVRVKENFHHARGMVVVQWESEPQATEAVKIPRNTAFSLQGENKRFLSQETITLVPGATQAVAVEAEVRGVPGQLSAAGAQWRPLEIATPNGAAQRLRVSNLEPLVLKDFGVVEVFVDGVDFGDLAQVRRLEQEIERVRAAGIYVLLKPSQPLQLDGIFQVALKPGQRLSDLERVALEQQLQDALRTYLNSQEMGQPLLLSQLTQVLLSHAAVNDLATFELTVVRPQANQTDISTYDATTKRLNAEVLEKFVPRYLQVASSIKPLVIHIQMQVPLLDEDRASQVEQLLHSFFSDLGPRREIQKAEICAAIYGIGFSSAQQAQLVEQTQLVPEFWHTAIEFDGQRIPVSLVEQAQLGNIFLYSQVLEVSGALKLTLPLLTPTEQQEQVQAQVRQTLSDYLNRLKPEESIDINQLSELARTVHPVLEVLWQVEDFSVTHQTRQGAVVVPNRIDGTTIRVARFEKAILSEGVAIASSIQPIPVQLTQIELGVEVTGIIPARTDIAQLQALMQSAIRLSLETIRRQLPLMEVAQSLNYQTFKDSTLLTLIRTGIATLSPVTLLTLINQATTAPLAGLESTTAEELAALTNLLLQGAKYTVRQLLLNNTSQDITARIIERITLAPIDLTQVSLVIELPPVQPDPPAPPTLPSIPTPRAGGSR